MKGLWKSGGEKAEIQEECLKVLKLIRWYVGKTSTLVFQLYIKG